MSLEDSDSEGERLHSLCRGWRGAELPPTFLPQAEESQMSWLGELCRASPRIVQATAFRNHLHYLRGVEDKAPLAEKVPLAGKVPFAGVLYYN